MKATVVDDHMQRSPVFIFDDAMQARDFGAWVTEHSDGIRAAAESTTRSGKLSYVGQYQIGPLLYLRLNYTTGDAAGQNMTGKATLAACEWVQATHPLRPQFILSGNIDTDKKHSRINMLLTRGKRVVAEATIKDELLRSIMGVSAAELFRNRQISMAGSFLVGSANNGAHAANGLTALFIATGQDVANVSESHAAIVYTQLTESGDYYWSITLPALIVATYGGGTGLPTQRECLEMLGCDGSGKVMKFAEICAAVVLAGETSLSGDPPRGLGDQPRPARGQPAVSRAQPDLRLPWPAWQPRRQPRIIHPRMSGSAQNGCQEGSKSGHRRGRQVAGQRGCGRQDAQPRSSERTSPPW